jgi:drug/metabolite transporter (DMT)-like permease
MDSRLRGNDACERSDERVKPESTETEHRVNAAANSLTRRNHALGVAAMVAVIFTWSGWIITSSWGVRHQLNAWDITFLRFATAAAVTAPWLWLRRRDIPHLFTRRTLVCALACGFPYTLLSFWGMKLAPASNAGVIVNGLLPVLTAIFCFFWMGQRISADKYAGIALIALANALIFLGGNGGAHGGTLLLLGAALMVAFYSTAIGVWQLAPQDLLLAVPWWNFLLFAPIYAFAPKALGQASAAEIALQMGYQGVLVSVMAVFLISLGVQKLGSVTASAYMGAVPVVAAILSFIILHEPVRGLTLASIVLCSAGLLLYNLRGSRLASS